MPLSNGAELCGGCNSFVIRGDRHPRWCKDNPPEETRAEYVLRKADAQNEIVLSEIGVLSEDERLAFQAGLKIGARQERRRAQSQRSSSWLRLRVGLLLLLPVVPAVSLGPCRRGTPWSRPERQTGSRRASRPPSAAPDAR